MTAIKFCGLTRREDVALAVELGVEYVGFVLWPDSPRQVSFTQAAALIDTLPDSVTPVGVFVRPSDDDLSRGIDAGVRVVQVHGQDTAPEGTRCDVWMAAALREGGLPPGVDRSRVLLLDAHDPARHGGTGRTIDWAAAARVAATRRVMLAGGLSAANVADAIRRVRPVGVDVASGIEDAPGVKNSAAMRAFVAAVREADRCP